MFLRLRLTLIPCALLVAFSSIAFGFNDFPGSGDQEIPRLGWGDEGQWIEKAVADRVRAKASPIASIEAQYGGNWTYQQNTVTGSLHRVYGSGVNIAGELTTESAAENAARSVIGSNENVFGATNADLNLLTVRHGAGKWAVHFDQMVNGLRVVGGRAHTVFTESGRLFAMGSDVYPDVEISTAPTLSEAGALSIAAMDVGFLDGRDGVKHQELLILPVRVEMDEQMMLEYRLAYRFDLDVKEPLGFWETYVDANSGEILWRRNLIMHAYDGHAQGDVEYNSYCDAASTDYPMEGMGVNITGVGTVYCDANGDFSAAGTGTTSWSAAFIGRWINVDRYTGTNPTLSGSITSGTPITIDWNTGNSLQAEMDVFSYINEEHTWIKNVDPSFTGMDYEVPCSVQRTDGYCPGNAWYSPSERSINFCLESASYGNTAQLADVAYHEWGHGLTYEIYPSYPRTSMGEGNSDIIANLLTRESVMGFGFYLNNCSSGIRNSNNSMQYPGDWSDSHTGGQIIAGFIWDSWQALQSALPQAEADSIAAAAWHFSRTLGLPATEPDQVYWTFVADDDDGNLDNGTPNHAAFCVGASSHGFDCPAILSPVVIVHTPVTGHASDATPIPVAANITSPAAPINVGALAVYYQVDGGGLSSVGMSSTGGDNYSGSIPAQSAGALVEYYIYAEDNNTNSASDPTNAPFELHPFFVGDFQSVFADDFETDQGWTVGDVDDDATTGLWELGDPEGTTYSGQLQPEDDHTANPGTDCYATQLAAGASAGTYDVDGGKTTLFSPVIDLSSASLAQVRYWRWYTNDQGNGPGEDYWHVSVNDGSGWQNLEYTTASDNSWSQKIFGLGGISLTSTVQFRFIASDEINGSLVEAALDDFEVLAILPPGIDPDLSTIVVNTDVVTCPAGDGDSTLTITVTAIDGGGTPVAGIPAGDVVVDASGVSSLGHNIGFCNGTPNVAQFVSTSVTNASGETTIQVSNLSGCGSITLAATISGVALNVNAVAAVTSPDLTGDGLVSFFDLFEYLPELGAGTGGCSNFNNDPGDVVDFHDTMLLLPHLGSHQCP